MKTELDEALTIAREDHAKANLFYDTFLNTSLFIPAQKADKSEGTWTQIQPSERFFPLYLNNGETKAVPVFDHLERLKSWAAPKTFDYIVLPAHLFLKVIADEISISLNEGTESAYLLLPKVLNLLRQNLRAVSPN